MTGSSGSMTYRAGVAVAVVTSFLIVWTTIVRDDGSGTGYFMIILAALVGAFAAAFQPAGMARAMLGVAAMQALLGLMFATAPITAKVPDGVLKAIVGNAGFTLFWLIAAVCFRAAARRTLRADGPSPQESNRDQSTSANDPINRPIRSA